jgi:hypothetical protein
MPAVRASSDSGAASESSQGSFHPNHQVVWGLQPPLAAELRKGGSEAVALERLPPNFVKWEGSFPR